MLDVTSPLVGEAKAVFGGLKGSSEKLCLEK
jgi:hypothetical protein